MKNRIKYNVMSEEEMALFSNRMETLLSERGIELDHPAMLAELAQAGCLVEGTHVKFPVEIIHKAVDAVPKQFKLYGREEAYDMEYPHPQGGFYTRTCTGAPFYMTPEGEKKLTHPDDAANWFALVNELENISFTALPSACDPSVPEEAIDVYTLQRALDTSRKHVWIQPYEAENVKYLIRMCQSVAGGAKALKEKPFVSFISCSVPVLTYKYMDAEIMYACAKAGIPVQPCSLPTAGANAPVTGQGVALVACTEVLAQIVMLELLCPGLPVIATPLLFSLDMKTAYTLQSNTEITFGRLICMQVFEQHYDIRCHSYGTGTDSVILDEQNMIERTSLIQAMAMSDASVLGGAGQFDTAKTISPLQLIIDNEIFEIAKRLRTGLEVSDETMNYAELLAGNDADGYLRSKHTRKNCKGLHRSKLFNTAGAAKPGMPQTTLLERAKEFYDEFQKKPVPQLLSEDVRQEINAIVEEAAEALRRK